MSDRRILICEDDSSMRSSLEELLGAAGWQVRAVNRAGKIAALLGDEVPDVILSDVKMPGMSGLDLLESLTPTDPPLVLISAHGDIPMAVEAMSKGAYSFVEKPYEPRRLLSILSHAADQRRMQQTNARLRDRLMRLSGLDRVILGQTEEAARLRDDVLALADTEAAVLLQGETGTGKELVARALHDLGPQGGGPFVALNCATLSEDLFAAQVHGAVQTAHGGTLFLDEIASCPLAVQAQLLRIIEDKRLPIDEGAAQLSFRVISATNLAAAGAVKEGLLRQDLYYRISTTEIALPPLRHRIDDIALLTTHFMADFARVYETAPPELSPEDLSTLLAHPWPGNVRELRNVAERRVLSARRGRGSIAEAMRLDEPEEVPETLRAAVASLEREMIGKAIVAHEGRMDAVAEAMGIGRRTLNEKIVKLGLDKASLL